MDNRHYKIMTQLLLFKQKTGCVLKRKRICRLDVGLGQLHVILDAQRGIRKNTLIYSEEAGEVWTHLIRMNTYMGELYKCILKRSSVLNN